MKKLVLCLALATATPAVAKRVSFAHALAAGVVIGGCCITGYEIFSLLPLHVAIGTGGTIFGTLWLWGRDIGDKESPKGDIENRVREIFTTLPEEEQKEAVLDLLRELHRQR